MYDQSSLILPFLIVAVTNVFAQQNNSDDYKIYSQLINTEVPQATKSVTIIKKLDNESSTSSWATEAIKSKDPQQLEQLRFSTRDNAGNSVALLDTATQNLILGFYLSELQNSQLTNSFDSNLKIFLVDKYSLKNGSKKEWRKFYKKYPGSGGLFQFSYVYYSQDEKMAIFFHSLRRNGLNGHGALTIMQNISGQWKVKYHINLWQE